MYISLQQIAWLLSEEGMIQQRYDYVSEEGMIQQQYDYVFVQFKLDIVNVVWFFIIELFFFFF